MTSLHELRRKTVHIILGTALLLGYHLGIIAWWGYFLILVLGSIFLLFIHASAITPIEGWLSRFDRKDAYFPGWGAITLVEGFLIASVLFPKPTASALMAIITFGDGAAAIIGTYLGKRRLAWNHQKTIAGTAAGMIASLLTAAMFLPWPLALVASGVGMIVETIKKPDWLDDNFLIPLAAGTITSAIAIII